MATVDTHPTERRKTPDRRADSPARRDTSANKMSALDWIAMTLLIIGGVNWGLIGLFSFDLVAAIFGQMNALSRVIYTLVGISALYAIFTSSKMAGKNG